MFALNYLNVYSKYHWIFVVLPVLWGCAQQGSPSGGPRDEDPPVVVESDPPNYSTHFKAKKVLITFNEYIVLENVNQQLIVSPPMEEQPQVKLRKKTLIMEFEETLKDSTTYTFNFGDAIKDLHEGNKLQNFEYVISTGDILDSMSVKGTLKYAENMESPDEPVSIMLYTDLRDSVPLTDIPLYVGRSNDSGTFSVNNLRPDIYKVFALKDGNNNLLFDLPTEEIAFLDTSLILNPDFTRLLLGDSLFLGSAIVDSTTVDGDTTALPGPDLNSIYIDLALFTEASDIQYITDYTRDDRRKLVLVFALPLTDSFYYRPLQTDAGEAPEFLEYFSPDRDSLTLWVRDSVDYKKDSISLAVNYTVKDTTDQFVTRSDTLLFPFRKKQNKGRRGKEEEESEEQLTIHTIRNNGSLDLNRDLPLTIDFPIEKINDSLISLFRIPDSVEVPVSYIVKVDTLFPYRVTISTSWEPATQYRIAALPGAISSIYPIEHDTIDLKFKTHSLEDYGKILLTLNNVRNRVLIQLFTGKTMVSEMIANDDGQYVFPYLAPKEYHIKFIHDINKNGKWDTGKYIKQLQPEPVELLPVQIEVRSNWDHEVTMNLKK
jgi:hypothetical protein